MATATPPIRIRGVLLRCVLREELSSPSLSIELSPVGEIWGWPFFGDVSSLVSSVERDLFAWAGSLFIRRGTLPDGYGDCFWAGRLTGFATTSGTTIVAVH